MALHGMLFGTNYFIHLPVPQFVHPHPDASYEQILHEADLLFDVEKRPVYDYRGREIEHVRAVHRTDTEELLGVVGTRYEPIPNLMGFRVLDRWLQNGQVRVLRAGHFDRGRVCTVIACEEEPLQLPYLSGDRVYQYLVLVNSFDGSYQLSAYLALMVQDTVLPIPSSLSLSQGLAASTIAVRHVRHFAWRLGAQTELPSIPASLLTVLERAATIPTSPSQRQQMLTEILIPEQARRTPERLEYLQKRILPDVEACILLHPLHTEYPALRETLFGFLIGFCYWTDTVRNTRKRQPERRYYSLLLGSDMEVKRRAFEYIALLLSERETRR